LNKDLIFITKHFHIVMNTLSVSIVMLDNLQPNFLSQ